MRLQQILGGLTPAEKSALKVLDESGRWGLMYDAALEDGWSPGGQRSRTFQKKGRYSLIVMFDPGKPNPSTGLFAEREPEPEAEIVREPIRHRPLPWVNDPIINEPEPEPIELVERVEPIRPDEHDPGPIKVVPKKKKRLK